MTVQRFIQPLDVLFLRDNHLFGAAGDASGVLMPPWPSVFAGALRSRMLADSGARIAELNNGSLPAPLDSVLGTPEKPGTFTLGDVTLARQDNDNSEAFRPLPADIAVTLTESGPRIDVLCPQTLPDALATSNNMQQLPLLRARTPAKPTTRYGLNAAGWQAHLRSQSLDAERHLEAKDTLWRTETRLGIALDTAQGSAAESQLYTSDAVALRPGVGFLVTVHGADETVPADGLLRLGGDGRGASIQAAVDTPAAEPDWDAIRETGRFRMILTSPGIFPGGDRPPGASTNGDWHLGEARARLVSQAVPRHEVVSGWDMSKHGPKPAQRCAPAGSVYWFENFDGDMESLRKLSETGLWDASSDNDLATRRAEGFNRVAIANA